MGLYDDPRDSKDPRIEARAPVYVLSYIAQLETALERAKSAAEKLTQSTGSMLLDPYSAYPIPIADGDRRVRVLLGRGHRDTPIWLDVRRVGQSVELHGSGQLFLAPRSTNVATMDVGS
jgi:hypothetical protein